MASLKEIAKDVGVSHALVSRVLSNRMGTTRVSEKTRQKILDRAKELNYTPNPLAVALKRGRKGAVGVFLHAVGVPGSELSQDFMHAAAWELSSKGYNLWMQFFNKKEEFIAACNEQLLSKVDGLILAGMSHGEIIDNVQEIEKRGLPVVFSCHGDMEQYGVTNYQVDSEMQAYLTTKHLLEIGCQRVAHFMNVPIRYQGYLRAHEELGVKPDEKLVVKAVGYKCNNGVACTEELLKRKTPFDAIATQSDGQAAGVYHWYALQGIPRREWPLVTGIDDSPIARDCSIVPLTSATAEMDRCAHLAVTALHNKLEDIPVKAQQVAPKLVIRESTQRV
ncbi:LacI family DNA-binding transcriptional regulator [Cerasicoccus frondis]|uniref:LacI family DNA-binding transcriptional regulator n=1 Tax=Cerasicoccus frondis TaxID=490090 RepID=UPI00285283AA|nr:LacI family DNA-binding transcriptional regulator [Cerasicoccus frondis]